MGWTVSFVNQVAQAELDALPLDMQSRFARIADMIEGFGLPAMREPHVKHLNGKLWEIRLKGRDGIGRSIYIAASGQRVIVLRTFVKKTQKTPSQELELALQRMKEIRE
jgi:phage-related protein